MTRVFAHGELHLALLALLRQQPMHGYELMTRLERMLGVRQRHSAGSVYPALSALQAEGLLDGRRVGRRSVYQLTATGLEALEERSEDLAALEARTGLRFDGTDGLDGHLARFGARLAQVAPLVDADAVEMILDRAATEVERLVPPSRDKEEKET
jgi:DNA-binding PadR family transcriptional regulator